MKEGKAAATNRSRVKPTTAAVHAHFYQPPRENPWTEEVLRESSAAPFHDWNERISAESYRPNAFARILDGEGRVLDVVNNYAHVSFNIGPTLMSWLERHQPDVYARVIEAHRSSGGAIAQAYNHMILPLASERDMRTQVRWGLADFRHRFGCDALGMWLPETAVNEDVMRVLAEEGVGFTVLAPYQGRAVRPLPGSQSPGLAAMPNREWQEAGPDGVDPRVSYRWAHPHDEALGLDVVFYDGALSHDLAFSSLSSQALIDRVEEAAGKRGGLVAVALDGETFGHHHKWMDRSLAYALTAEAPRRGVAVANLATWLAHNRPARQVMVRESAWSCAHGVGRWHTDCGCSTGGAPGCNQQWRAPLRAALDLLRDFGVEVFDRRGDELFGGHQWAARDAYVEVLLGVISAEEFAERWVWGDPVAAFTLLEAQRSAMLMYTSCGWFFHDLAGLETAQVLRYAARVIDLLLQAGEEPPTDAFFSTLAEAESFEHGNGLAVWARHVEPARVGFERVAAHLALSELFGIEVGPPGGYDVETLSSGRGDAAVWRKLAVTQRRTGARQELLTVARRLGESEAEGVVLGGLSMLGDLDDDAAAAVVGAPPPGAWAFDAGALLPDAAETLLAQVMARVDAGLAGSAESLLSAAHWASLAHPAGGDERDVPLLPEAMHALAERATAQRLVHHLDAGEPDAALLLARRARRLGLEIACAAGTGLAEALAALVRSATARAVAGGPDEVPPALEAVALAAELCPAGEVPEAQEAVFAVARSRRDLWPLAEALGLSPEAYEAGTERRVTDRRAVKAGR